MTEEERKTLIANLIVIKGFVLDDPAITKLVNDCIRILDKTGEFKKIYQEFRFS